jgi:hypothetical protein
MGWIERVWGSELPRIPVHQLRASIAEAVRGNITANDVQNDFSLTDQDRIEIVGLINSGTHTPQAIEDVLVRAEYVVGSVRLTGAETATAIRERLGIA